VAYIERARTCGLAKAWNARFRAVLPFHDVSGHTGSSKIHRRVNARRLVSVRY
jgi:hypothetical protein